MNDYIAKMMYFGKGNEVEWNSVLIKAKTIMSAQQIATKKIGSPHPSTRVIIVDASNTIVCERHFLCNWELVK